MHDLIRLFDEAPPDSGWSRADKRSTWTAPKLQIKTLLTFLSQGAVGGAVAYFLLAVFSLISYPNYYNYLFLSALPMFLGYGSAFGSSTAVFVWLPGVFLQRRLGFVARAVISMTAMPLLAAALAYLTNELEGNPRSLAWLIGIFCGTGVPVALITGSRVSPWRMIFLGSGPRVSRHNFGSWLSIPFGFLLRVANVFCLLEALMTLAVWISYRRSDGFVFPAREHLPVIVLAVLFFAISTYLSFRSPRKFFLLPIAILLNLPLAVWLVNLTRVGTLDSNFLGYPCLVLISLWALYTLGRMIAPESARGVGNPACEMAHAQKVSQSGAFTVQL